MLYFLLVIILLLMPLTFRMSAETKEKSLSVQAEFMVLGKGIKIFRKKINIRTAFESILKKKKGNSKNKAKNFTKAIKYISLDKIGIKSELGTGDAATTAIVSGQVFGLVAPLVSSVARHGEYNVDIMPIYGKKQFNFTGECIFSFNIANAIVALIEIAGGNKNGK